MAGQPDLGYTMDMCTSDCYSLRAHLWVGHDSNPDTNSTLVASVNYLQLIVVEHGVKWLKDFHQSSRATTERDHITIHRSVRAGHQPTFGMQLDW